MQLTELADMLTFAAEIVPGGAPVTVFCDPIARETVGDCFGVVDRLVTRLGGQRILGRQLWHHGLFIEAELHAIWEQPDGIWLDVTPRFKPMRCISFLVDPDARYDGSHVDNIRKALVDDPLVHRGLDLARQRVDLLKQAALAERDAGISQSLAVAFYRVEEELLELREVLARRALR